MEKGRVETAKNIARNLRKQGLPTSVISQATQLSEKEIEDL